MIVDIPDLLTPEQLQQCRQALMQAEWTDGRQTAGHAAARAKHNQQLPPASPLAVQLGEFILKTLGSHPLFMSAALPLKVLPPQFNRYQDGGDYGNHVDSAVFSVPDSPHRIRSDLSATVFFSEPGEYDGGELVIEDTYGPRSVKLPAGHMVLYPGSSLHRVTPVTRGARLASFFWIQSLVREDSRRSLLFELDQSIQQLGQTDPEHPSLVRLMGVYHNLLRQWSDT